MMTLSGRPIILLLIGVLCVITVHQLFTPTPIIDRNRISQFIDSKKAGWQQLQQQQLPKLDENQPGSQLGYAVKHCILQSSENLWDKFVDVAEKCIAQHSRVKPNDKTQFLLLHMGRFGEIKYFLPLVEPELRPANFSCKWLTIGIGGDSQVEKEMKTHHPECDLYGVEPGDTDQYADFKSYGTVIPKAVGVEKGELTMRLRVKTTYEFHKVPIEPMPTLLDQHLHTRLVHFSTLDIEGFEYPLLKAMETGQPFEKAGVRFCQIDVELHSPEMVVKFNGGIQNKDDWDKFVRTFFRNTDFVPVQVGTFLGHRKVTLVDPTVPECVKAFDLDKFLT